MAEGRLQIYEAEHKIIDFLVKNRANNENRRLTRQEVRIAVGLDEQVFGDAYEDLRMSGSVLASNSEGEMWVTTKGMEACFRGRVHNMLDASNKWLDDFGRSLQQQNPLPPPSSIGAILLATIFPARIQVDGPTPPRQAPKILMEQTS